MKRTALYDVHRQAGAKLVSFQGWEMPVQYSGLIAEHMAVRQTAGLFDVSHMGELEIVGPGALQFLQRVTVNDVAKLEPGRGQYTALPTPDGAPVDDVVLFERDAESFLMLVPAGHIESDLGWLQEQGPNFAIVDPDFGRDPCGRFFARRPQPASNVGCHLRTARERRPVGHPDWV